MTIPGPTRRWTVGELAKQAGVSAGILRHYDRLGLLRPTSTSGAGYRLYTEQDRARLELIRALRALDFDLETIGRLLSAKSSVRTAAELHLETLDLQARVIGRRRAVLRVLLQGAPTPERLARLQVLSDFERRERERFLDAQLARRMRGRAGGGLEQAVRTAASVDLPETPSEAQVEAWLELAEMVSDPTFLARHKREEGSSPTQNGGAAWIRELHALCAPAAAAARAGVRPGSPEGRPIVRRWMRGVARQWGTGMPRRRDVRSAARKLLEAIESGRDAREERFWQLVGVLKPEVARSAISVGWPWLIEGLRVIAGQD